MTKMEIIKKSVGDLEFDSNNVRKHDKKNLEAIKYSLERYGQQKPIVINKENVVLAGNGTLVAAKLLGWKEINCVVSSLKGLEATGFAVADNRASDLAGWGDDELKIQLESLDEDFLKGMSFQYEEPEDIEEEPLKKTEDKNICPSCGFHF